MTKKTVVISYSSVFAPVDNSQVVVVGAGLAGLSAAKELLRKGWPKHKVVVLEASGNFGGRVSDGWLIRPVQ